MISTIFLTLLFVQESVLATRGIRMVSNNYSEPDQLTVRMAEL